MGCGLESCCVGRVYCADDAGRTAPSADVELRIHQ